MTDIFIHGDRTNYRYTIQDTVTLKYYHGAKWGKGCTPDKFWKEGGYFTSSATILDLVETYGANRFIVRKLIIDKNAYENETRFLKKVNAAKNPTFYNWHNNDIPHPSVNYELMNKRNESHRKTISDPKWKNTVDKERAKKQKETKSDPQWKSTIGKKSVEKMLKTNEPFRDHINTKRKDTMNSPEWKEKNSWVCEYCSKIVTGKSNYNRYHGNNCKMIIQN